MPTYLKADNPANPVQWGQLVEAHTDVTGAAVVEVASKPGADGKPVLWVNVNGICLLRICQIQNLVLPNNPPTP